MTAEFERTVPPFRLVATHYGDDLQAVAAREMGDANRWTELVWLNNLIPPYITDLSGSVVPGVVLSGSLLKVPSPVGLWSDGVVDDSIYEKDAKLTRKRLTITSGGDIAVVSGVDNLSQQLSNRIVTPVGQARRHGDYGCLVWRLIGRVNGPMASILGGEYVRGALKADYRVDSVESVRAVVLADTIKISATAIATAGGKAPIEITSEG